MKWNRGDFSKVFSSFSPKWLRCIALLPIMINSVEFYRRKVQCSTKDYSKFDLFQGLNNKDKDNKIRKDLKDYDIELFQVPLEKGNIEEKKIYKFKINNELKIVFLSIDSKYYAFYGGCPFDDSELSDYVIRDKIFCSKHGEIFDATTGRTEYGPVLEDLEHLEVLEKDESIFILIPNTIRKKVFEYKRPVKIPDFRRFVVIGNDVSSLACLQTIRREGFVGELYFLFNEDEKMPYDWKEIFEPGRNAVYKTEAFLKSLNVSIIKGVDIKAINIQNSSIELEKRAPLRFDKIIMANSFVPSAVLNPKMTETFNTLNTFKDYEQFIQGAKYFDALEIEGALVEGLELVYLLHNFYEKMKLNKQDDFNLRKIIIKDADPQQWTSDILNIAEIKQDLKKKSNIELVIGASPEKEQGKSDKVKKIRLCPKFILSEDLLHQDIYKWDPDKHNSILVDVCLQHLKDKIYVAGNLTSYPYWYSAEKVNIKYNPSEAIYQGKVVAKNIMGSNIGFQSIPFSSYKVFGNQLNVIGIPDNSDQYFLSPDGKIAYFLKDGNLAAAATLENYDDLMILRFAMLFSRVPQAFYLQTDQNIIETVRKKLEK